MTDKLCRTCNQWTEQSPTWLCFDGDPEHRVGECMLAEAHGDRTNPMIAAVCESEGIYGQLITAHNFGCILWEERPDFNEHF